MAAIPYYAEGDFLLTPYAPYDQVVGFARKKGVDFIVIGRGEQRPLLADLLIIKAPKPEVRLKFGIRDRRDPDRLKLAVYRVLLLCSRETLHFACSKAKAVPHLFFLFTIDKE